MTTSTVLQTLIGRPVSTTTVTFDWKSEKFELFEDILTPDDATNMMQTMKINHFHSLLRKNAIQTFRNTNSAKRQTPEDILVVLRRKHVKLESEATAKHKWHRLVIEPNTMKLQCFLKELNQGAKQALGKNARTKIDILFYAKLTANLKCSINLARHE